MTGIKHLKLLADFQIRIMDAMVKEGPQGGSGALRYDNRQFFERKTQLTNIYIETTIDKYNNAANALAAESASISNRLRILDESLKQ